jgi:3'-5' exonuclease
LSNKALCNLLTDDHIVKVGHATENDRRHLADNHLHCIDIRNVADTMTAVRIRLQELEHATLDIEIQLSLDYLLQHFGLQKNSQSEMMNQSKHVQPWQNRFRRNENTYPDWMKEYAAQDVYSILRCWELLTGQKAHEERLPPEEQFQIRSAVLRPPSEQGRRNGYNNDRSRANPAPAAAPRRRQQRQTTQHSASRY